MKLIDTALDDGKLDGALDFDHGQYKDKCDIGILSHESLDENEAFDDNNRTSLKTQNHVDSAISLEDFGEFGSQTDPEFKTEPEQHNSGFLKNIKLSENEHETSYNAATQKNMSMTKFIVPNATQNNPSRYVTKPTHNWNLKATTNLLSSVLVVCFDMNFFLSAQEI